MGNSIYNFKIDTSQLDAIQKMNEEKFEKEEQDRKNLQKIAESSGEATVILKEQNELLKQSNQLLNQNNEILKEKLTNINISLQELFSLVELNYEENSELQKEANEIAKQIQLAIIDNGKFDFKSLLSGTTSSALFMGIQVYLHQKGLL